MSNNAEDRMGRAFLIVLVGAALAVISAAALVFWIFWNIAGYVF